MVCQIPRTPGRRPPVPAEVRALVEQLARRTRAGLLAHPGPGLPNLRAMGCRTMPVEVGGENDVSTVGGGRFVMALGASRLSYRTYCREIS